MSSSSDSPSAPSRPSTPDAPGRSTSASKSRPRFTLPTPGSSEFIPALAAGVLVLLIALQIALPYATEPPLASAVAPRRPRPLRAAPIPPYPGLVDQDIFDPQRKGGSGVSGGGADAPLQVMGVVSSSRGTEALMKAPGAATQFVGAGGAIGGWKVVSIGRDAVWVAKGDARRRLAVGASAGPAPPPPPAAAAGPPVQDPSE